MTPAEAADLKNALDNAVKAIADKFTSEERVRARLDFLMWRVMTGRCTDFFNEDGNVPQYSVRPRTVRGIL